MSGRTGKRRSGEGLRHGYTTGACAAAAAKGAALMLRDQRLAEEAEIILPSGERPRFSLHGQEFSPDSAACFVVKDAGDDPDVTNGAEIHARVTLSEGEPAVVIEGGTGVGKVTKPGLAVPVGEWAINPVPRRMIEEAVREVFTSHVARCLGPRGSTSHVIISIPNGEELAKKTLNARLGIVGGLSILGTTGIVRPISARAWTDTIDSALDVALACGSEMVVLSTGRTSELVAQGMFEAKGKGQRAKGNADGEREGKCSLPEESFIMMGDHVGHALRACAEKGIQRAVLAAQFAKLLKIACGHEQTHAASSELDLNMLSGWVAETPHSSLLTPHVTRAHTAREALLSSGNDPELVSLVCSRAKIEAQKLAPGVEIKVLLAGYASEVLYFG